MWIEASTRMESRSRRSARTPSSSHDYPSVRFEYRYRDYSNFKRFGEVVFSNPDGIPIEHIQATFETARRLAFPYADDDQFSAEALRIPTLYMEPRSPQDDHPWHEAVCFERTDDSPLDEEKTSITDFLNRVRAPAR